jgi:hypothetical protein
VVTAYGESVTAGELAGLGYDESQHAWTSRRALTDSVPPRVVSKRPPEHVADRGDSGWTVGYGDEPALGSEEFEWSPVGELAERFPHLAEVFRAGSGEWRWSNADDRYVSTS